MNYNQNTVALKEESLENKSRNELCIKPNFKRHKRPGRYFI